jgi:DHA2 family multidrug resistance protein
MLYLTHLDTLVSFKTIAIARVFQAGGLAFLFVPINTIAYIGLPPGKSNNASALINAMRNLGGSVGISFVTTVLVRRGQFHQNRLVGDVSPFHLAYRQAIANAARHFIQMGASPAAAARQAFASITQTLLRQAQMLSYIDVFKVLAIGSLAAISLAFFLKTIGPEDRGQAQGH